jgi:hypothetical protein
MDLLLGTAALACVVAYGLTVGRDFEREQATLVELGLPPFETLRDHYANPSFEHGSNEWSRGGPSWLRELMPESFPMWFDRVVQVEIMDLGKFASTRELPNLRAIKVQHAGFPCGAEAIAALGELQHLEAIEFNWFYPRVGSENYTDLDSDAEFARGLRELARLPRLVALDVADSTFGDQSAAAIAGFSNLRILDAHETLLTDEGVAHLAKLESLEELHLDGGEITDEGVKNLASLRALKRLSLWAYYVTDQGLEHIAELKELEELNLWNTSISGPGLRYLDGLSQLKSLGVPDKIDRSAVTNLKRKLPHLKTSLDDDSARVDGTIETVIPLNEFGEGSELRIISDP